MRIDNFLNRITGLPLSILEQSKRKRNVSITLDTLRTNISGNEYVRGDTEFKSNFITPTKNVADTRSKSFLPPSVEKSTDRIGVRSNGSINLRDISEPLHTERTPSNRGKLNKDIIHSTSNFTQNRLNYRRMTNDARDRNKEID